MIDLMSPPENIDHERDENNVTNDKDSSREEIEEAPSGYYYDDTTGYEVFRDEGEAEEESSRESNSR